MFGSFSILLSIAAPTVAVNLLKSRYMFALVSRMHDLGFNLRPYEITAVLDSFLGKSTRERCL